MRLRPFRIRLVSLSICTPGNVSHSFSRILFTISLLSWPFLLVSQQYNFTRLSVENGLAQSQVYSILQDSRGYLWMGTRGGGVSLYDGMEFKNFTAKDG